MSLKIAFVIPYFYPAWEYGGQPRSAYELARGLVKRGHSVQVFTTDSGGRSRLSFASLADHRRQVSGIRVTYYRNISNSLAFKQRFFWAPQLSRNLAAEIRGMDVVHIHELRSAVSVSGFSAARSNGIPYVVSPHGGLRHLGRRMLKTVFDELWGKRILRNAAAIMAVSPVESEDAIQASVEYDRIRIVPNAIEISDYTNLPGRGAFKKRFGLQNKNLILFLGRLHWIKGPDVLVRAFAKICSSDPNIHLVIAGPDDGQGNTLHNLTNELRIEQRVTFAGFLDQNYKVAALSDAALTVIPSRSEVFALTAVEALLCKSPVLLSSICGLSPLPPPNHGLQTFRNEDIEDLAKRMILMLAEDGLPEETQRGRAFVMEKFCADRIAELAEGVYEEVVSS